jgi:cyclophilin family peptidyl-prolyl cis-trans isomerase
MRDALLHSLMMVVLTFVATSCRKSSGGAESLPDSLKVRPQFVLETRFGDITLELFDDTPIHRDNFVRLAAAGFYDGLPFSRVIPGLIIQCGDESRRDPLNPALDSLPVRTLPAEIKHSHFRGTIGAARKNDDENPKRESNGSQFYINLSDNRFYDGSYTCFGKVISGMDVVDKISMLARDGLNNPHARTEIRVKRVGL